MRIEAHHIRAAFNALHPHTLSRHDVDEACRKDVYANNDQELLLFYGIATHLGQATASIKVGFEGLRLTATLILREGGWNDERKEWETTERSVRI